MQVTLWDICMHDWTREELGFPPLAREVFSLVMGWMYAQWFSHACLCGPMNCGPPGFSVNEVYQARIWSGLPCSSPGDLPNPGIELISPTSPAVAGRFFYHWATWEAFGVVGYRFTTHSFHRWSEWGQKDWLRFLKATQLVSGRANLCWPPVQWDKMHFRLALCFNLNLSLLVSRENDSSK